MKLSIRKNIFLIYCLYVFQGGSTLLLNAYLAKHFGINKEVDAYFFSLSIIMAISFLGSSNVSATVVNLFYEIEDKNGYAEAIYKLQVLSTYYLFFCALLSVLLYVFSGMLSGIAGPAFIEIKLAIYIFNVLLIFLFATWGIAFAHGILMVKGIFFIPIIPGIFINLFCILLLFFFPNFNISIMAHGMSFGQLFILFCVYVFLNLRYGFRFYFSIPDLKIVFHFISLSLPLTIGLIFMNFIWVVEKRISISYGEGVISSLGYAWRLLSGIQNLLSLGIKTVSMPILSRFYSNKDFASARQFKMKYFFILNIIGLISVIIIFLNSNSLASIVYMRGNITNRDLDLIILCIKGYLGFFFGMIIGSVVTEDIIAQRKRLIIILSSFFCISLYCMVGYVLPQRFGVIGIPLTWSITYLSYVFIQFFQFKKLYN